MIPPPTTSTLFPYTTLFRSPRRASRSRERPRRIKVMSSPASIAERCEGRGDRKSTRLNSSHVEISYAVFCLKKKKRMIVAALRVITAQRNLVDEGDGGQGAL